MNILVCVKQVPNTKHMTIDPETHRLVRHGVSAMLNPADRYALEKALRFRDQHGGTLTAISMGAPHAGDVLVSAHVVGADRCILLTDAAFAGSDTFATASVLAAAIRHEQQRTGQDFDVIFCGRETIDGETGQVGPELAQLLGCPFFTNISRMDSTGISCRIEYTLDDVRLTVDAAFPMVIAYPLRDDAGLRSALPDRLEKVADYNLPRLTFEDLSPWLRADELGLTGSATRVLRSYVPSTQHKGVIIRRGTPAERARQLVRYLNNDGLLKNTSSPSKPSDEAEAFAAKGNGRICVFVEQNPAGCCREISLELLSPAMEIARQAGLYISAALIGCDNRKAEQELAQYGVHEIISCESSAFANLQLTDFAAAFGRIVDEYPPAGILFGSTALGKELAARLAGRCRTGLTAECTGIRYDADMESIVWSRPAYGGKLMADIVCAVKRPQMGTIREGVFVRPEKHLSQPNILRMDFSAEEQHSVHVLQKTVIAAPTRKSVREISMVVGMGKGIRDMDGFDLCCDFADAIGAELGASRGCLELHLVSQQYLLGSNGRTIRPRIYFACGISGALQHMTGVNDSQCIVAINRDPNAEIFKYADYGIVGDLFQILPALQDELEPLFSETQP